MIEVFNRKNNSIYETLISYIKQKDSCINDTELRCAITSNITNQHSCMLYSIDENKKIDGTLFGIEDEPKCWLIQGFFFNSNNVALDLSKYAYEYLGPKHIIYKKFSKHKTHTWSENKIKKYLEIIN